MQHEVKDLSKAEKSSKNSIPRKIIDSKLALPVQLKRTLIESDTYTLCITQK